MKESIGRLILRALRGTAPDFDYTAGPIGPAIVLLAVPMVVEMFMESLFAVVDIFFVSHLGADAVATVGLTEAMLTLVYTMAIGLSIGVTATVARRIGEKDKERAAEAAVQGLLMGVLVAAVLGVVGVIFAADLLRLMGATPEIVATGHRYTAIMLGGEASVILLFLINAVFRGGGDAAMAMRVLILANGLNMILGPCFIFGVGPFPKLGVTGAAVGTTLGRGIGVLFALWLSTRPTRRVRLERRHLRVLPDLMRRMLAISGSAVLQNLIGMASWIGLVRIVSGFGAPAVAGYTIGIRVIIFGLLPSWGLANAAATMVGQSLGAKNPERAKKAVKIAGYFNLVVLGAVGLLFVVFAHGIVGLFTHDPAVVPIAVSALRIISAGFAFYAWGMVFTMAFNGAGDTWTPTWINLFCFWLFELPLAWYLAHVVGLGPTGAFLAVAIAFSSLAVVSGILFRRGRWARSTV